MTRKRVAVIGTGGSISTPGRSALDLFEYAEFGTTLPVEEVVSLFSEYIGEFEVVPIPFEAVVSTAIGPSEWLRLNELIHSLAKDDQTLAGIVITHGTATLEETAYFLNLTLKTDVPVVIVGAQRPPNGLSTDAGLNLLNAVRAAASPQCRGLGVLVALNGEIHAAREVTKTANFRLDAFRTPDFGCLGYVDPDAVVAIYRIPARLHTVHTEFDVRGLSQLPRVDILYSYAGSDGAALEGILRAKPRAIVSAGFGPGKPTPTERKRLAAAADEDCLVIQCSRTGSGRIGRRSHPSFASFLSADNLNPQKARVLAMVGLAFTTERDRLQTLLDRY